MVVGSLLTIASGQWLGEKLSLLDTLRIPAGDQCLAYNRQNRTVYLGGSGCDSILVIDADYCRKTEWIAVGRGVEALCYNPTDNKLYCAYVNADTVAVLDGTTHQMLAGVAVDSNPGVLCLDSIHNKLYVGNRAGASVCVIDCRADTVTCTIDCGRSGTYGTSMLCLAASASRLFYALWRDSCIVAIDCSADTLAAVINVGYWLESMCFSSASNRLYCSGWRDTVRRVYGIDAGTDSVVWSMAVRSPVPLCCDPAGNRLFMPDFDTLLVVDCATGSTIVRAKLDMLVEGVQAATSVDYDPMDSRIYVVCDGAPWCSFGSITVWDGEAYRALKCFNGYECGVDATCITDARARFFFAGSREQDECVAVLDKRLHRVVMWANWCSPAVVYADSTTDRLYCLGYPSQVIVVDQATNRVVSHVPVDDYPSAVCFNPIDRKVYVACAGCGPGALDILDGVGDSLLTGVDVEGAPTLMAFNLRDDILYAADPASYWIWAIGGKTDSVVGHALVSERPVGLVYNEAQGKLYSFGCDGVVTVIRPDLSRVICRIAVAAGSDLFAFGSDGSHLYCGDCHLTLVYVIDCVQDRLVCAVPVVAPLASLYCSQHDNMLYCGSQTGELSVIDCANNSLVGTIPASADFIHADSATDAIYCLSGHELAVVDRKTRAVLRTLDLGTYVTGLASAPDWPYVYLAEEEDPYLLLLHKASGPAEMAVPATKGSQATVVRGRLDWTGTLAVMYDRSGRRVADVHRGGNDVSRLQPGVYFVRQNGVRRGTYARKVVITR